MTHNFIVAVLAVLHCFIVSSAFAQVPPIVDGTLDAIYVPVNDLTTQSNTTGFGDSNLGVVDAANGSELDGLHAVVIGEVLYLFLGGNLESNFNKLEVFIDAKSGGQNRLPGNNPDIDFNGLNRMGDDGTGNGLRFDTCFSADFYITSTCGGAPIEMWANIAQLLTEGGGQGAYIGSGIPGSVAIDNLKYGVKVAINNSNIAGVGGDGGNTSGAGVTTGIEMAVPLILLGYDPTTQKNIKICAAINGGGHDYLSNQFLAPLAPMGNLGEPRNVDLSTIEGNQYAVLVVDTNEPDCAPRPPACPPDFNGDLIIDGSDLATLLSGWGTPAGDTNGDQTTDGSDLATLLSAWGPCV